MTTGISLSSLLHSREEKRPGISKTTFSVNLTVFQSYPLRKKCPNTEFFRSVFCHIWTEYGDLRYLVQIRENTDQKNTGKYGPKICIWTLFTQIICKKPPILLEVLIFQPMRLIDMMICEQFRL